MASTDTRSGFRLPWSSDRSHEDPEVPAVPEDDVEPVHAEDSATAETSWPGTDIDAALGLTKTAQRPPEAAPIPGAAADEPGPTVETAAPAARPAPSRKPSRLMADLSAAIRATAESARSQSVAQVEADSQRVVQTIRSSSTEGAAALKHRSEEDIASIREWSKAEIARIREETDARITTRKATLEDELAAYAAAVERRVEAVTMEVERFEAAMAAYLERLAREDDPSRLATMAEELPEPPSFEAWTHAEGETAGAASVATATGTADAPPEAELATGVAEAPAEALDAPEPATADAPGTASIDAAHPGGSDEAGWDAAPDPAADAAEPAGADPWLDEPTTWAGESSTADGDDVPRWAAGDAPEGFPEGGGAEGGDPVDRGAIMAALEAAAEAVVAAEAAAESADQAEAAADVAETAAELLVGRTGAEDDYDPEAAAAMAARVDAGGFDTESFADRLASLLPGHGEGEASEEPRTTQVVVSGLVSVASIASFKRHLGRLAGVQSVAVASGPEGEFVFNVTHRADLSFRDVLPTMPGFAARVTTSADGVVNVTARDPEAEG